MSITKERHNQIQEDAQGLINNEGGIGYIDEIAAKNKPAWNKIQQGFQGWLMLWHEITAATARRHVAKAARVLRNPHRKTESNWGGDRRS